MSKVRIFLKEWRNYKGLTLEELASRIGMETIALSRAEHTPIGFTVETMGYVAEGLGIEPADLLKPPPG